MTIQGIEAETHGDLKGKSVVLIHGILAGREIWNLVVERLGADISAVTYDLRGAGQSEVGSGQYTLEAMVNDLVAVLSKLKLKRTVLCGQGLGAHIAFRALEREPDRVAGVISCNELPGSPSDADILFWSDAVRQVQEASLKRFVRNYLPTVFAESSKEDEGSPYQALLAAAEQADPRGVVGHMLAYLTRTDTKPALEAAEVPLLAMTGEEDPYLPYNDLLRLGLSVPGLRVIRIPDSGHTVAAEHPKHVADAITYFVQSVHGE